MSHRAVPVRWENKNRVSRLAQRPGVLLFANSHRIDCVHRSEFVFNDDERMPLFASVSLKIPRSFFSCFAARSRSDATNEGMGKIEAGGPLSGYTDEYVLYGLNFDVRASEFNHDRSTHVHRRASRRLAKSPRKTEKREMTVIDLLIEFFLSLSLSLCRSLFPDLIWLFLSFALTKWQTTARRVFPNQKPILVINHRSYSHHRSTVELSGGRVRRVANDSLVEIIDIKTMKQS